MPTKPKPKLTPEQATILEQYYRAEYQDMVDFATALLKDRYLAEVAVQDTFTATSQCFQKFYDSPNRVGWLYNALKLTIRHIRSDRYKVLNLCVSLEITQEPSTEMELPSDLNPEESKDLRLVKRFYYDGYTLKDLAKELNTTPSAVKMRLKRARERLKKDPLIKSLKNFKK